MSRNSRYLPLAVAVAVLGACGGSSGDPPVPATPRIVLAASSLTFSGTAGGGSPASQDVTVSNSGGGSLALPSATPSASWITAAVSGSGPAYTVTVGTNLSGLSAGTHTGSVSIASAGAANTPQSLAVTLTLVDPPRIALAPSSLTFSGTAGGGSPASQDVTVSNSGGGSLALPTLSVLYFQGLDWLSASVDGASAPYAVTVTPNLTGLASGVYHATVSIASQGASNTPQVLDVTLTVQPSPEIALDPQALSFAGTAGGASPPAQTVSVGSASLTPLAQPAVSTDATWLTASVTTGGEPYTVTVTPDITGLAAGVHHASVSVASAGAGNTPQSVSVSLTLVAPPRIALAPSSLAFGGIVGGSSPATQAVTVSNSGGGSLALPSATPSASWITAAVSGSGPTYTVTVGTNLSGLPVGTHTGSVSISSVGADNTPQSVAVGLTLTTPPSPGFSLVRVPGTINLPTGTTLTPDSLQVDALYSSSSVTPAGTFELDLVDAQDQVVIVSLLDGTPVAPARVTAQALGADLAIGSAEMAAGFISFNPAVMAMPRAARSKLMAAARLQPLFQNLVGEIEQALRLAPHMTTDFSTFPTIRQYAAQVVAAVLAEPEPGTQAAPLPTRPPASPQAAAADGTLISDPPSIVDAPGGLVTVVNPTYVFYGVEFRGATNRTMLIEGVDSQFAFQWGWPPAYWTSPVTRDFDLGDGTFDVMLYGAVPWFQPGWYIPGTAAGMATYANLIKACVLVLNSASFCPFSGADIRSLVEGPTDPSFSLSSWVQQYVAGLARDGLDWPDYVDVSLGLMENFYDELGSVPCIGYVLGKPEPQFFAKLSKAMNVASAWRSLVTFVPNSVFPFAWDLAWADQAFHLCVSQSGGTLSTSCSQFPPAIAFSHSPVNPREGDTVTFDASATTGVAPLTYSWDFDGDGRWDVTGATSPTATHAYPTPGAFRVMLTVRDGNGYVANSFETVFVERIARGSASHVILLRDNLPWASSAFDNMMTNLGISTGPDAGQYEVVSADAFAASSVALRPGVDLVAISNDQSQYFYDVLASQYGRLMNFAQNGGTIFWEACDQGWGGNGNMAAAGLAALPGGLALDTYFDPVNVVVNPDAPVTFGLPSNLTGNFASHEGFSNLPPGAVVYTTDTRGRPTLLEYHYGQGWIVVTGQPLEWGYDRLGEFTIGQVWAPLIRYILNLVAVAPETSSVIAGQGLTLRASGGSGGYTWALASSSGTASLSATAGEYVVYTAGTTTDVFDLVTVTDSSGASAQATLRVIPAPPGDVVGTVRDAQNPDLALGSVQVDLREASGDPSQPAPWQTWTSWDGTYAFYSLPAGGYVATYLLPGYASRSIPVQVSSAQTVTYDVTMTSALCAPQTACGNGFFDAALGEQCDPSDAYYGSYFDPNVAACVNCSVLCYDTALHWSSAYFACVADATCGNGYLENGETCDDSSYASTYDPNVAVCTGCRIQCLDGSTWDPTSWTCTAMCASPNARSIPTASTAPAPAAQRSLRWVGSSSRSTAGSSANQGASTR